MTEISANWRWYRMRLHQLNMLRSQGKLCPIEALVRARRNVAISAKNVCQAYVESDEPMLPGLPGNEPPNHEVFEHIEGCIDGSAEALLVIMRVGHGNI